MQGKKSETKNRNATLSNATFSRRLTGRPV